MVSVVTGSGLGLDQTSGFVLGSRGQLGSSAFGRYGEGVTVNAATGNLFVNRTDEILIGLGVDAVVSRSYNSLGLSNDDNADNWQLGGQRRVAGLTGTVNTAGSTVTRYDWDGSSIVYTWDATKAAYLSAKVGHQDDRITFASNVWSWTDSDSRTSETYDDLNGGRITAVKDADNNTTSYSYTGSLLTRITTASGEYTDLTWSGNNLMQVVTTKSGGATLSRVSYGYANAGRLSSVTTDLTPDDNSVADGVVVSTNYTYDGTSDRIASISQTGGAKLEFTYVLVGADYRVATYKQTLASGVTSQVTLSYDTANRVTTLTDQAGQSTKLTYDTANRLTKMELPPAQAGALAQITTYTYDAAGNVLTVKDASNNTTTYQYDANGNLTLLRDAAGNTVTYTYGVGNELLAETHYAVADPDGSGPGLPSGSATTRYVYDTAYHLLYTITAEGGVTQNDYFTSSASKGLVQYQSAYTGQVYDTSGLSDTQAPSAADMVAWVNAIADKSTRARTEYTYDFRGNVATAKNWSAATSAGAGTGTATTVTYTYDQYGNLLTRQTSGIANTEVFTYDGLGRMTGSVDLNGGATSIVFTDGQNKQVVTLANGLVQASTYNLAGQLISYATSGTGLTTATASYKYDTLGRQRIAIDALGNKSYALYDATGRKVADIAADGALTEYRYDANDNLTSSTRYANKLDSQQLAALVDGSGNPTNVTVAALRPAVNASDVWSWRVYDAANRLVETIDANGDVTTVSYDGMSQQTGTRSYANKLSASQLDALKIAGGQNLWANPQDGTLWGTSNVTKTAAGLVAGANAFKLAATTAGVLAQVYQPAFAVSAGDTVTMVLTFLGDGAVTTNFAGLFGSISGFASGATISAKVLSGPGTVNAPSSAQWTVSGLSTTIPTQIAFTRTFTKDEWVSAHFYIDSTTASNIQAGDATILSDPIVTVTPAGSNYWASPQDAASWVKNNVTVSGAGTVNGTNAFTLAATADGIQTLVRSGYAAVSAGDTVTYTVTLLGSGSVSTDVIGLQGNSSGWGSSADTSVKILSGPGTLSAPSIALWNVSGLSTTTPTTIQFTRTYRKSESAAVYLYIDNSTAANITAGDATVITNPVMTISRAAALVLPTADSLKDAVSRNFYDKAGRLLGALDALGYLSQVVYDAGGRAVHTVAYANLTTATLRASGTFADLLASVGTNARDIHQYSIYYNDGKLRYTLDANLRPTEYVYDAAGNLLHVIDYGASIGVGTDYSGSYVAGQISTLGLSSNANTRKSWSVYDNAGRLTYAIDAAGGVTGFSYDSLGQVTKTVQFAVTRTTTSDPTLATMDTWASANGNVGDRVTRSYYDRRALRYVVDAAGFVTRNDYDLDGKLTRTVRWDTAYAADDTTTFDTINVASKGTWLDTNYAYDPLGRLSTTTDALGVVTKLDYDALDRVTDRTVAYGATNGGGTSAAVTTHYVYDAAGRVTDETAAWGTADATTTHYTYDGFGHVLTRVSAYGAAEASTTAYTYDELGQVLTATSASGTSIAATSSFAYDGFGNVIAATDPRGNVSYSTYDTLNRLTWQVDAEGYVTQTSYAIGSEVASVTRYAAKATASGAAVVPTVASDTNEDATTFFTCDKLGRVTKVTDALGGYEQYTLDAFGNRLTVRNKLGGMTTNTFDRRGLLVQEVTTVTWLTASGATQAADITNTYAYDSRGNRTQMVEAVGLAEQRTTTYTYDKLNRLTKTTGMAVGYASDTSLGATGSVALYDMVTYDKRGNVIETKNAAGERTLFYYDALDRKIAQVSAVGTLSTWTYDKNGNATSARVYGDPVALQVDVLATPPSPINASNYRETTFTYDQVGRLLTSVVSGVQVSYWNGTSFATPVAGNLTVSNAYDKSGNITKQTDARGNSVYFYYDKLGRKVAQVDQENYLTTYALDADGNVITETRYATKLTGTPVVGVMPTLPASVPGSDRVTAFTYDRNGRRLTEARQNVTAWTIDGATGALSAAATTATIVYTYNAFGEVTKKTEATGEFTDYTYDSAGRQKSIRSSSFVDFNNNTVKRLTEMAYNGLGNLTSTTESGVLASNNYTTSGDAARTTSYLYDASGRLVQTSDAVGISHYYEYDLAGRVIRDRYWRTNSAGAGGTWEANESRYDAAGRAIKQAVRTWNGANWLAITGTGPNAIDVEVETRIAYNTYGEAVGKGLNATDASTSTYQETFDYDAAGRVWRSTAGDGVIKLFLYDQNGNQSTVITSNGAALPSGYTWSTLTTEQAINLLTNNRTVALGTLAVAGIVVTQQVYDKRGQVTQTRETLRDVSATGGAPASALINHQKTYNAFGEVLQETNARGFIWDYTYNTLGKVIQRQSPTVSWTAENGVQATARPTENYYYDLSGRVVGVQDANGNLNTKSLLAGTGYGGEEALTLTEFHADTGKVQNKYNAYDDLRISTDEVGKSETYIYDKRGLLIEQDHQQRADGTQLKDYYGYNDVGQRIWHYNSQLGSSVKDTLDYDALGRVTTVVDMGGNTTAHSYSWNASAGTSGLGTFGGWNHYTTNAATQSDVEVNDYFGRLIDKWDYGSHDYNYTFNSAGQLVQLTNALGLNTVYTYYNTGLVSAIVTSSNNGYDVTTATSSFRYDAEGNRTAESHNVIGTWRNYYAGTNVSISPISFEDISVTYDSMNRITAITGNETPSSPTSVTYEYDRIGNIRYMNSNFYYIDDQGVVNSGVSSQIYWYKYDSMNRFVITKGQFSGERGAGSIIRGNAGLQITYSQAGQRETTTSTKSRFVSVGGMASYPVYWEQKETYTYTDDGYLAQVNSASGTEGFDPYNVAAAAGPGDLRATYSRDAMGRVTSYTEYSTAGAMAYSREAIYNTRSQVSSDSVISVRSDGNWRTDTNYFYDSAGDGSGTYQGGGVTRQVATNRQNDSLKSTVTINNVVDWWDGAVQSTAAFATDNVSGSDTNYTSTYHYDDAGRLASVYVQDGRSRTISFINSAEGMILSRDETDNVGGSGDPRELHFYLSGITIGDISNNGTSDVDYATSIANHTAVNGTGPFRNGATSGKYYADFDQSYDPINGLNYEGTASRYTVQTGDTLDSIALQLWGDASFWYMIADANGLAGSEALVAGMSLVIPNKVHNSHNSSDTYRVYDPNEAIGDTSPTAAKPPKKNKCGVFGQILLVVIAVAVVALTQQYEVFAGLGSIGSGAASAALGSVVSQGVGVATGIQDKFSFKAVALAAVGGAVGKALKGLDVFKGLGKFTSVANDIARGALGSAITQGIGRATHLQDNFSWAGVAAAGVGAGIGNAIGGHTPLGRAGAGMAGGIAASAAQSLVTGQDFGDTLMSNLPSIIANTIGNLVAEGVSGSGRAYDRTRGYGQNEVIDVLGPDRGPIDVRGLANNTLTNGPSIAGIVTSSAAAQVMSSQGQSQALRRATVTIESGDFADDRPSIVVDDHRGASNLAEWQRWYDDYRQGDPNFDKYSNSAALKAAFDYDRANLERRYGIADAQIAQDAKDIGRGWLKVGSFFPGIGIAAGVADASIARYNDEIDDNEYFLTITTGARGLTSTARLSTAARVGSRTIAEFGACFVAGTLVHTPDGLKPIEQLRSGDLVMSQPEIGGEQAARPIVRTVSFDDKSIWQISYANAQGQTETIRATDNHPFWVEGIGWTAAELLEAGQSVQLVDGNAAIIVAAFDTGSVDQVFNFEVDGFHTYYVGQHGVWVHNTNCAAPPPAAEGEVGNGLVYLRTDTTRKLAPYVGQTTEANELARQAAHARTYPNSRFEFDTLESGIPRGSQLDIAEHNAIQARTGGVAARRSSAVSNQRDPVGPLRRPAFGLPEPR